VDEPPELWSRVRVVATGAEGTVVEVSRRHKTADVDLGDDITAEFSWDEIEPAPRPGFLS
jgi:hypothetical protein